MNQTAPDTTSDASAKDEKFVIHAADHFQKLYYEALDKRRHLMSKLYLDTGVLIWNGHSMTGPAEIQKFFSTLAPSTHTVSSVDSMFVPAIAVGEQKTIMVNIAGNVLLKTDYNRTVQAFCQTFIITHVQDKWKIVSDIFRIQTPVGITSLQ